MHASAEHAELFSDALLERAWHQHSRTRQTVAIDLAEMQSASPDFTVQSVVLAKQQPLTAASPHVSLQMPVPSSPAPTVTSGRWSTGAVVACVSVASSITAAVILYHFRDHPNVQPILQPLLRALRLSSAASDDSTTSQPAQDIDSPASSADIQSADAEADSSLITVDEQQLIRLFHLSLQTLQTSGCIDGELEQALYRHLQTTHHPSPSSPSSHTATHAALRFVAVQWLLLHCTLQLNSALSAEQHDQIQRDILHTHMPLCWSLLSTIQPAPVTAHTPPDTAELPISDSALNLLRLDVAQRLHDAERLEAVFDAVWRAKQRGEAWTVEEAVVLCTVAPHIGRWDELLQLADLIQQAGADDAGDGLQLFHQSAMHRRDIVDYQVVMELARDEMDRRLRARGQTKKNLEDEHKEQEPSTTATTTKLSSSLFPPLPNPSIALPTSLSSCTWSEHILLTCDSLYTAILCSHPHLQQHADRIHQPPTTAHYTPCPNLPQPTHRLSRQGRLLTLTSPLSPRLRCAGFVGEDGWMRLAGWAEADEGPGGRVRWREEWRLAEAAGGDGGDGDVGMWEGERMVERLRRKHVMDGEEEQVRVQWTWKVRLQLQSQDTDQ